MHVHTVLMASQKQHCYTFEVVFPKEEQKTQCFERMESARQKLEHRQGGMKLFNF